MRTFRYVAPTSLSAAAELLAERGASAVALAGGTDLLGILKDRVHATYPDLVVGLKAVSGYDYIRQEGEEVAIGALARLATVASHPLVCERYPLLAQAAHSVGSPQLRGMGTVGGNLCQETRCWYYRSPGNYFPCFRKGGRGCFARAGDNRFHSIFGSSGKCVAVASSELAPALIALGAVVTTTVRSMQAGELFAAAPGASTVLRPGELVQEIRLPAPPPGRQTYQNFRVRGAIEFAVVSVASFLRVEAGRVAQARFVLGGVAPVPREAIEAGAFLLGRMVTPAVVEEAGAVAVSSARPLSRNGYKVQITRELVKRAILGAGAQEP